MMYDRERKGEEKMNLYKRIGRNGIKNLPWDNNVSHRHMSPTAKDMMPVVKKDEDDQQKIMQEVRAYNQSRWPRIGDLHCTFVFVGL
ncbi:MAG: hypothetical protein NUV81_00170 [bacterium]|nr:hypothetical protein [bacterium]